MIHYRLPSPAARLAPPLAICALSFVAVAPAHADVSGYALRPRKCSIVAHLLKGGIASGLAHDHVVSARVLSGQVEFDPGRPEGGSISIEVDARSLDPDAPALRRKYGMKSLLDEADRREVRENLHGKRQLHSKKYPRISFRSSAVERVAGDVYKVSGRFTLRGVTRSLAFQARVEIKGDQLRASARLRLKQSDFGYKPYSAALGTVKVKDWVMLNIYLEGERLAGSAG